MENPTLTPLKPSLVQTHKTYGLIIGLIIVVLSAVVYVAGMQQSSWVQWVLYAVFLGGLVLNANAFSKANGGMVSYGQLFSSGFKTTAIIVLLVVAWVIASVSIFPEMKENALELARAQMEQEGKMDAETMETALNVTRNNFTTFIVMGSLFGYMILGLIFSLLAAAVTPRIKRPTTPVV